MISAGREMSRLSVQIEEKSWTGDDETKPAHAAMSAERRWNCHYKTTPSLSTIPSRVARHASSLTIVLHESKQIDRKPK